MESWIIQLGVLLLSIISLYFIIYNIKHNRLTKFETTALIWIGAIVINIFGFSFVYIVDKLDGNLFNVYFYNYWSSFIRVTNIINILWLVITIFDNVRQREGLNSVTQSILLFLKNLLRRKKP